MSQHRCAHVTTGSKLSYHAKYDCFTLKYLFIFHDKILQCVSTTICLGYDSFGHRYSYRKSRLVDKFITKTTTEVCRVTNVGTGPDFSVQARPEPVNLRPGPARGPL